LFHEYCAQHGKDASQLPETHFTSLAKKYCGVTTNDLVNLVYDTPMTLWGEKAKEVFARKM
jgi:hypothetical protein